MDKKRGKGTVSVIKPIAVEGRMCLFFKGKIRLDYSGSFSNPYVLVEEIEFIEQAKDKKIMIPIENVSGIVFDEVLF